MYRFAYIPVVKNSLLEKNGLSRQGRISSVLLLLCFVNDIYCIHATRRPPLISAQPPVWPRGRCQIWRNSMWIMSQYLAHLPVWQRPDQKHTAHLCASIQYLRWFSLNFCISTTSCPTHVKYVIHQFCAKHIISLLPQKHQVLLNIFAKWEPVLKIYNFQRQKIH